MCICYRLMNFCVWIAVQKQTIVIPRNNPLLTRQSLPQINAWRHKKRVNFLSCTLYGWIHTVYFLLLCIVFKNLKFLIYVYMHVSKSVSVYMSICFLFVCVPTDM